jgi:hypothetical protein
MKATRQSAKVATEAVRMSYRTNENQQMRMGDNLQDTDSFESGEYAVDALDEIIGLLADVY